MLKKCIIKCPAPDSEERLWWGDYWIALDLRDCLTKANFDTSLAYANTIIKDQYDVNFVIRGPKKFERPDNAGLNVLYMMSCPQYITNEEIDDYDIILSCSKKFIQKYAYKKNTFYLPQFTNTKRFFYEEDKKYHSSILFVGNPHNNWFRPSVKYALRNNFDISIYGKYWEKYIDKRYIKGEYIDNNELHKYYSNADIVLNDTFDNMKKWGIISNRIFDATACKAFIISDYIPEIREFYGDNIPMYKNEKEFVKLLQYYLSHPKERKAKAENAYNITMRLFSDYVFTRHIKGMLGVKSVGSLNFMTWATASVWRTELERWHKKKTGLQLNLNNPKTFNEKIQWSKLYDSTPIKTRLADKYLVRDWVAEKIGEQYLIPLLGVYDSFDEIDFDKLPKQFIIKCNHGSGYNIIVKDKSKLDLNDVKAKLDKWIVENFAFKNGCELHYRDIPPKIIIEKFIENKTSGGDLYDYKFWCFNGKVEYIQFLSERNIDGLKMAFYDKNWNKQDFVYSHPLDKKNIEKPSNLDKMIKLAEVLSADFNHVRVDFYRMDDGKLYFGEMTFTSASGVCKWNDEKINRYFGKLFKLPKLAYNIDTGEYYKYKFHSQLWCLLHHYHPLTCFWQHIKDVHFIKHITNIHPIKHFVRHIRDVMRSHLKSR